MRKGDDAAPAFGIGHIRQVALRADRVAPSIGVDPGFNAVDQHDTAGRRAHCREQQSVIAPRAFAANSPGSETAESVRLQPLSC